MPTVTLTLFKPSIGDMAAYVNPEGQLLFTGKVTKIIPRKDDTLYKLESNGKYEWGYSCGVVRPEDVPEQKVQTWEDLRYTPTPYIVN